MDASEKITHPRLRQVELFPLQHQGRQVLCLRDPNGLAEHPIFLSGPLIPLVTMMDGTHSLRDLQAEHFRRTGEILYTEKLEELVAQLESLRYLDSHAFRRFHEALVVEFRKSPVRPATHAGAAYESEPDALKKQLDAFFGHPEGPGPIAPASNRQDLRGLIAPHIDYHRGGPTYAHAYKALAERSEADRFVIFGTSHHFMERRFALTRKGYETPLGRAETDEAFVDKLAAKLPRDYFEDEFAHRGEHSIEFQAVCLRYVLGERRQFRIVPVLVGSFHDLYAAGRTAEEDDEIMAMADAVRQTMSELPGDYCILAGADLAHVGRRFGDPGGPTPEGLRQVEREDRRFLELVEAGDAEGVFRSIAEDHDRRRVCGYPPIYMTLRCIDRPKGRLLQYRQWSDLEAGAAVTYASVAIF